MKQKTYSCPNCGAPITGCRCEYCGTVFRISKDKKQIHEKCETHPEFWLRELHSISYEKYIPVCDLNPASFVISPVLPTKVSR